MEHLSNKAPDPAQVLGKAALRAIKSLGLTQQDLAETIGRHRSKLAKGIDPNSKQGELAMMVIRCYRSLYALLDGNTDHIAHWMKTQNRGTGGVPATQIKQINGLYRVQTYLDAMRAKV